MILNLGLAKYRSFRARMSHSNDGFLLALVLAIVWPALPAFLFAPDNWFSEALDWSVLSWSKATGLSGMLTSGMTVSGYFEEYGPARFQALVALCVAHLAGQLSFIIWTVAKRRTDLELSFGYLLFAAILFAIVVDTILSPDIRHGAMFPSLDSYWFLPFWALGKIALSFYACSALKAGLLRDPKCPPPN